MVLQYVVYGQNKLPLPHEQEITVYGEVINKENGEIVPYVHIIDKNTHQGTTSDLSGRFEIRANKTDTLIFSAVGFEKDTLLLNKITSYSTVQITLEPAAIELDPVEIYAFKDAAAFKQAILDLKLPEEKSPDLFIPGTNAGQPRALNGNLALASPLTAVQNLFSKEAKELKKYQEALREYPREKLIREKYNRKIVGEITGLKDESLNDFMLFCNVTDDFIIKANEYEIVLAVNKCYKSFLETKH